MSEVFEGHLDHCGDGLVYGWVRSLEHLEKRLTVEISLSNSWKVQVCADRFREDLLAKSIGDGKYGFEVKVPFRVTGGETVAVGCKVAGTGFHLQKSGSSLTPEFPVMLVAGDIVDNCNLRCPFCVTDYANIRRTRKMPRETFEKSLDLLELVPDGMFWLSCMHEATMHPDLLDLLDLVPVRYRRKISFTTNLCKRMDDIYLRRLAASNVQALRISVDSLDPDLFGTLRKGGKLSVFWDNLKRLSAFLKEVDSVTEVHFVTMAFKSNLEEIPVVVKQCREVLVPARHEIRFMFYVPHASEWGEDRILDLDEWDELKVLTNNSLGEGTAHFYDPEPGVHAKFKDKPGLASYVSPEAVFGGAATPEGYIRVDPMATGTNLKDEPLRLRLRWDGLLMMETLSEDEFRQNVLDVDREYFLDMRESAYDNPATWERIGN